MTGLLKWKYVSGLILLSVLAAAKCVYGVSTPKISIPELSWDIGTIELGQKAVHVFKVENVGSEELRVTQIRSSCSCLQVQIVSNTIQPGGYSDIEAVFKEDERLGETIKTIYIHSNDPDAPYSTIRVKAIVRDTSPQKTQSTEPVEVQTTQDGTVCVTMFFSEDCDDCIYVRNQMLPTLHEKFPDILNIRFYSIDDIENYDLLVSMEERFGDMGNEIPVIFIGKDVLGGREEVAGNLEEVIEKYLSQGGCDFPQIVRAESAEAEAALDNVVYLAYFEKPGCKDCDRASYILRNLKRAYPSIEIRKFNSEKKEDIELFEAMCSLYKVPEKERLIAPSIFLGDHHLPTDQIKDKKLRSLVEQYREIGTTKPWEDAEKMRSSARENLIERFKSLGPFAIVAAGLIDGINPCAFATIILFMSYLALIGRRGRDLVYVGIAFTAAVFLTYFLVGLGAFQFLQSLTVFSVLSRILYILIAVFAFVLGVLSLYDFIRARRGESREMFLQLPGFIKDRIHKTIRGKARTERFVIAAFVAGAVVSLLELACTGQVYLPTLCFVIGVPELRKNAIFYLALYNFMFILPLAVIFVVTYFGTSFTSLARVLQRHVALIKLLTSILFFGLCAFLLSTLI